MTLSPEAELVAKKIHHAFSGQKLGGGIGLREADSIDDHADSETRALARNRDERDSWESLSFENLFRYGNAGWWGMDSQGLTFHLPALILAELHDEGDGNLPFRLGAANRQRDWLWNALAYEQKLAVREFLLWASENSDWEADRELFRQGLSEFWSLGRIQDGEQ